MGSEWIFTLIIFDLMFAAFVTVALVDKLRWYAICIVVLAYLAFTTFGLQELLHVYKS